MNTTIAAIAQAHEPDNVFGILCHEQLHECNNVRVAQTQTQRPDMRLT